MAAVATPEPRITLIYPDGETARMIVDSLASRGLLSRVVGNLFRGISVFTDHPTEVVLLGLAGRDDRDLDLIRILREILPDVHLLVLFPPGCRELAVRALCRGADAYILEPFYVRELVAMVRNALDRSDRGRRPSPIAEQGLERLAGSVAHAINNPLQIVELLLTDAAESELNIEDLRSEARRITDVVDKLLAFAGEHDRHEAPLDLNGLLETRVARLADNGRHISLSLTPDLPLLHADRHGLIVVLDALLGLKTAPDDSGPLLISTSRIGTPESPWVSLTFHAPDLHLTEQESADFFLPFCGPAGGPVGLAAATARAAVSAEGGTVRVTSSAAKGTVVTVLLASSPCARQAKAPLPEDGA